jgi:hypothetical protein
VVDFLVIVEAFILVGLARSTHPEEIPIVALGM